MQVSLKVTIGDALTLRNSEVEHLEVRTALGDHTRMRIHFTRDSSQQVALEELLTASVLVQLHPDDSEDPVEIFRGSVTNGRQAHHSHYGSDLELEAYSDSHRLEHEQVRHYRELSARDVLSKLGFRVNGGGPGISEPMDFLQYKETDFAFAKRLGDEFGVVLRTDRGQMAAISEFEGNWPLYWGDTLLRLETEAYPTNHGVKGFFYQVDKKQGHAFHGLRRNPARFAGAASLVQATDALSQTARGGGDPIVLEVPFRAKTMQGYRQTLERESLRAASNNVRILGESTQCRLAAGERIEIQAFEGYRKPAVDGVFGLTEVVHVFDGQQYRNHFEATTAMTWLYGSRPERTLMGGIQTGLVVENIDPLKQGRVKVQFPWSTEAGRWYRVMAPYSGRARGVFFTPEIGDEVVVSFEFGDPERGLVIGSVWNGVDVPPPNGPKVKSIVTPSGSTIRFDDQKSGGEVLEIHTPDGKCLVQLNQNGGRPVLTLSSTGDISLEADGQVRVQSESFVVKTTGDATVLAGGNTTVDGKADIVLKAGANTNVQSGANLTLKSGGMMNVVGGALTNVVGSLVHIQPPGFMAPPLVVAPTQLPPKADSARQVPSEGRGKLTQDPPTSRNG